MGSAGPAANPALVEPGAARRPHAGPRALVAAPTNTEFRPARQRALAGGVRAGDCWSAVLLAASVVRVQCAGLAGVHEFAGCWPHRLWRRHSRLAAGGLRTSFSGRQRLGISQPAVARKTGLVPGAGAHVFAGRSLVRRRSMV